MMGSVDLDALFGTDVSGLEDSGLSPDFPEIVPGRVLHIDGDFLAYQISATKEERPLEEMMHNHDVAVETLRLLGGAEKTQLHITDTGSNKGNRYNIALHP